MKQLLPIRDNAVPADSGSVEHNTVYSDQRVVADRAAVQHHLVADGAVGANRQWETGIGVQHGTLLHVRALADGDQLVVPPGSPRRTRRSHCFLTGLTR